MTENRIYAKAKLLYGRESEELEELCATAEDMLTRALRPDAEGYEDDLVKASALLAIALMTEIESAAGEISYTAGAVSVKTGGGGTAAKLMRQAEKIMAPYSVDDGFAFLEV